jgi:hypothetical protein
MRVCALALAILLTAAAAHATQIYTDRASFEAAIGLFAIEDFESTPLVGTTSSGAAISRSFADFSLRSNPKAIKILDEVVIGAGNTTPGGDQYLSLDTDVTQGSVATFSFDFDIQAVGFDYSGLSEPGASPEITIAGETYSIDRNVWPPTNFNRVRDALFWGIISDVPFSTLVLDSDTDSGYGIDQVTYATTPEPGTVTLLALGLAVLASRVPTRRAR